MKFILDRSLSDLGIESVVIGIAKNVNPHAELSPTFLKKKKEREEWALNCDLDQVLQSPIIQGYEDILQRVGRSVKKNPPTVPALIKNIRHRGSLPAINTIIGGHDYNKIGEKIEFTVSQKEDTFLPILSKEKHVAKTDYVYRDDKGILAWLDIRDSDLYKFDDDTKDAIFIIQGNANTSVEMRLEALKRIQSDLKECMPDMKFEALVIKQAED